MSSRLATDFVALAERFRGERERVGYSQAAAARSLGVTREALRNVENAQSDFKVSLLLGAAGLGMDVQYILSGVRSKNTEDAGRAVSQPLTVHGPVSGVAQANAGSVVHINHLNKHTTRVVAQTSPGEEHISLAQRSVLKDLVDQIAETESRVRRDPKGHRSIWAALNAHCRVNSYHLISAGDFEKARTYLNKWLGRLNSAPGSPIKNADAWRNRRYAYIKINTKDPADNAALTTYIAKNFRASSLTELSNDELERAYRYVAGRRNRATK